MGSKKVKSKEEKEKEDRISDLPDDIIQHILSFLPSTKKAIQTSVLSKWWQHQWSQVQVLIFDSTGMCYENFIKLIDNTLILHDHSKIKRFDLVYRYPYEKDPEFTSKIKFATTRNVEELNLYSDINQEYMLPDFVFNHALLVKLSISNCTFTLHGKVNWGCLTALNISHCKLTDQEMKHILFGSPLLESLILSDCCNVKELVIASDYLKILDLRRLHNNYHIEISCPELKILNLISCWVVSTAILLNLPPSLQGSIGFCNCKRCDTESRSNENIYRTFKDILQQLQHVKELNFGSKFIEVLSNTEMGGLTGLNSLVLNNKCLTLNFPTLNKHYNIGISCALHMSPDLEKLVVEMSLPHQESNDYGENYWNLLNGTAYNCLSLHVKTIKIIDFPKKDDHHKRMLDFVQFLLENARVLEKMVVVLENHDAISVLKIHQELSCLPKCSENVIIQCFLKNNYFFI